LDSADSRQKVGMSEILAGRVATSTTRGSLPV